MKKTLYLLTGIALAFTANQTLAGNIGFAGFACDNIASCQALALNESPAYNQSMLGDMNPSQAANSQTSGSLDSLPKQIAPKGEKMFVFSPRWRKWAAYDASGERVAFGRANGGSNYCAELGHSCFSPVGSYRVYNKGTADCKSRKFPMPKGGAPMPYCMYFNGGYAIHGSPFISYRNGSHGCIRVTTSAAAWLHGNFISQGTKVMVLPY